MGIVRLPSYELYWSNEELLDLGMKKVMSCNHSKFILSFFHCADTQQQLPPGHANYDRLYKVREVCDRFMDNFQGAWKLGHEISVDETIIGIKITLSLVTYNPQKHMNGEWWCGLWLILPQDMFTTENWDIYTVTQ